MDSASLRLPVELLTLVFLCAQESDPGYIAGVCTFWREVAISLPELWSNCALIISGDDLDDRASTSSPISLRPQTWLQRSTNLPFSLDITTLTRRFDQDSWLLPDTIILFRRIAPRLTELTLRASQLVLFHLFNETIPSSLPSLQTLSILGIPGGDVPSPSLSGKRRPSYFPSLRLLTLSSCFDLALFKLLGHLIPWYNLTSLTWYSATMASREHSIFLLQITATTQSLTTCDLQLALPLTHNLGLIKNFKHLTLRFRSASSMHFLNGLTLPLLETLELYKNFWPEPYPPQINLQFTERLFTLCHRSSFPLTRLKIHGIRLRTSILVLFLTRVPTLVFLSVEYCHCLNSEFIGALAATKGDSNASAPRILPVLRHLIVSDSFPYDFTWKQSIQALTDLRCCLRRPRGMQPKPSPSSLLETLRIRAAEGDIMTYSRA
ncbi:hypothetical protein BDN72DRAFT_373890 [Pluteus cervinus]|uniref:Uncharacterized protein n=1 Tax=Pluteus cervinus TaxID=181527 RepID=A0ACD3B2M8_9AGAR|nr:hypothetical protein BDN72DRAFT_373890 [Pluteus cervinus]